MRRASSCLRRKRTPESGLGPACKHRHAEGQQQVFEDLEIALDGLASDLAFALDTAAIGLFEQYASVLRAAMGAPGEQLAREIARFEFEAARKTLRTLQKEVWPP